jgi:hypothetical protein
MNGWKLYGLILVSINLSLMIFSIFNNKWNVVIPIGTIGVLSGFYLFFTDKPKKPRTPSILRVRILDGKYKEMAIKQHLQPDDLVIVNKNSIKKIDGDPTSYLLKYAKKQQPMKGTSTKTVDNISINCITPEARNFLDLLCNQFKKEHNKEATDADGYIMLYWLCRYSELIQPTEKALKLLSDTQQ